MDCPCLFKAPLKIQCARGFPEVFASYPENKKVCFPWAAIHELIITDKSPLVGFFIPTGISIPLDTNLCCWFSTERAPIAT